MPSVDEIVARACATERGTLLEDEVLDLLDAQGLATPRRRFVGAVDAASPQAYAGLPFDRGVLKIAADRLVHKTEVGAVRFVTCRQSQTLADQAAQMITALPPGARKRLRGVLVAERVDVEPALGRELLLGLRHADALGPVLHIGFGGTAVETIADALRPAAGLVLHVPGVTNRARLRWKLERSLWFRGAVGQLRGVPAACGADELEQEIHRWLSGLVQIAEVFARRGKLLAELEINPLGWAGRLVALDGMARLSPGRARPSPTCAARLRRALAPNSVGIIGASRASDQSVGRIILENVLAGGFPGTEST